MQWHLKKVEWIQYLFRLNPELSDGFNEYQSILEMLDENE